MNSPSFIRIIQDIVIGFKAREFTSNDIAAELFKRGLCGESINKQALVWNAMTYLRRHLIITQVHERRGAKPAIYVLSDVMFSIYYGKAFS